MADLPNVKDLVPESEFPTANDLVTPEDYDAIVTARSPKLTAAPTVLDDVKAGHLIDAAKAVYEPVGEALSPILGPTEQQVSEQSVPVAQPDGGVSYIYKPQGDLPSQIGLKPAVQQFIQQGVDPLSLLPQNYTQYAPNPTDSTAKAIGKAVINTGNSFIGSVPGLLALPESRVLTGAFSADMLTGIPSQINQTLHAPTLQEKIQGGLGVLSAGILGTVAGRHALSPKLAQASALADANLPATADVVGKQGLSETINEQPQGDGSAVSPILPNEPAETQVPEPTASLAPKDQAANLTGGTQAIQPAIAPDLSGTQALSVTPLNPPVANEYIPSTEPLVPSNQSNADFSDQAIKNGFWVSGRGRIPNQTSFDKFSNVIQFTKSTDIADQYGKNGNVLAVRPNENANIWQWSPENSENVYNDFMQDHEDDKLSPELDVVARNISSPDKFSDDLKANGDIVNGAGLWDSRDFAAWFHEKYGTDFVDIPHEKHGGGAVILNPDPSKFDVISNEPTNPLQQPTDSTVTTQNQSEIQDQENPNAPKNQSSQDVQNAENGVLEENQGQVNVPVGGAENIPAPEPPQNLQGVEQNNSTQEEAAGARQEEPEGVQVSHTALDKRREKIGLPPIIKQMRRGDPEVFDAAMAKIDADPQYPSKLVDSLKNSPRALTAEEKAALAHEMAAREQDFNEAHDAINAAKTDGERAEARANKDIALQRLNDVQDVLHKSGGSEIGRSLRYSQVILDNDKFTRARMEARISAEINDGKPLTKGQEDEVDKLLAEHNAINKDEETLRQQAVNEHFKRIFDQVTKTDPLDIRKAKKRGTTLLEWLNAKGEESQNELKNIRKSGRRLVGPGLDPDVLYHTAIVGAKHLANGIVDLGKFTAKLVQDFGEWVRPHAQDIKDRAEQYLKYAQGEFRANKTSTPKDRQSVEQLLHGYTEKDTIPNDLVTNLIHAHIRAGMEDKDAVMKAVVKDLEPYHPDITQRQVEDAFSNYGKVKTPNQEPSRVKLREFRRMAQLQSAIDDANAGKPPQRTGLQRDKPTQTVREMTRELEELKRKYGFEITSPEQQMKSALDAVKTRLNNQIEDLTKQIEQGEKNAKKTGIPYDEEATELKKQKDELQGILNEIHGKSELTDEQRLNIASKAADRTLDRLDKELQGIETDVKSKKQVTSPELEGKRAEIEAMRAHKREIEAAENPKKSPEEIALNAAMKSAQKSIEKYDEMFKSGKLTPEKGKPKFTPTDQLEALRSLRDSMGDAIREMRKDQLPRIPKDEKARQSALKALEKRFQELDRRLSTGDFSRSPIKEGPASKYADVQLARARNNAMQKAFRELQKASETTRTPDQIRTDRYKTLLNRQTTELERKIKEEDFSKKKITPVTVDKEAQDLLLRRKKLQEEYEKKFEHNRLNNRTPAQRRLDFLTKVHRAFLLSSAAIFEKLGAAAGARLIIHPIEEAIGTPIAKLPFIRKIAALAPNEGGGFKVSTETKAIASAAMQGLNDAFKKATTGKSDLERLYGEPDYRPHDFLDIPGNLHGALKAPVLRAAYTRAFQKLTDFYTKQGADMSDPLVQLRVHTEALKYAQRDIFMQNNGIVSWFNSLAHRWETPDKNNKVPIENTLKKTLLQNTVPIVKIPTNIASEILQYAAGLISGSARTAVAFKKGMEHVTPDEADTILRELKKGSIGGAALALGFFAPQFFGGFYQEDERKKPGDVPFNAAKIPSGIPALGGKTIPPVLLHAPLAAVAQMGATIRKVADSRVRKTDLQTQGLGSGTFAGLVGVIDEVPFMHAAADLIQAGGNAPKRLQYLGGAARSAIVPSAVNSAAQFFDKDRNGNPVKRDPRTITQFIESGIPGLRQNVPVSKFQPLQLGSGYPQLSPTPISTLKPLYRPLETSR